MLEDFLRRVGDATAKLINMENYRRRRLFFERARSNTRKKIDCSWKSALEAAEDRVLRYLQAAGQRELPRDL